MKILKTTEEAFIGITLLAVTFVLFINIILRYFFSANTTWAEEFIRYAIIWITFIGSSICFRKGIHVGVDLLMESLPKKGKLILQIIVNVLAMVFMVFLVIYGVKLVLFSISTGQISAALEVKTFWIYLAIPVGSLLSLLHLGVNSYHILRNKSVS